MYVKKNMTLLRCPIEKGLDMLGGKWKSRILCVLAQRGPIRYGQFKQEMTNVTDTALSGGPERADPGWSGGPEAVQRSPAAVEYELTPYGLQRCGCCGRLQDWADGPFHRALPG